MDAIFELSDVWTCTTDPVEYSGFLWDLLLQMAVRRADGTLEFKYDADIAASCASTAHQVSHTVAASTYSSVPTTPATSNTTAATAATSIIVAATTASTAATVEGTASSPNQSATSSNRMKLKIQLEALREGGGVTCDFSFISLGRVDECNDLGSDGGDGTNGTSSLWQCQEGGRHCVSARHTSRASWPRSHAAELQSPPSTPRNNAECHSAIGARDGGKCHAQTLNLMNLMTDSISSELSRSCSRLRRRTLRLSRPLRASRYAS